MSHAADPRLSQYWLTRDEARRVNRIRLAVKLHKLPSEIDTLPYTDYCDLLEIMNADQIIAEREAALRAMKR